MPGRKHQNCHPFHLNIMDDPLALTTDEDHVIAAINAKQSARPHRDAAQAAALKAAPFIEEREQHKAAALAALAPAQSAFPPADYAALVESISAIQ